MKRIQLLLVLIVVVYISSCSYNDNKSELYGSSHTIIKRNNFVIPDTLFDFFPNQINVCKHLTLLSVFDNAQKNKNQLLLSEFEPVFIVEIYQCSNDTMFNNLILNFKSNCLYKVLSEDKDYFVIDSEKDLLERYDSTTIKENYLKSDKIILSFKQVATFKNSSMFNLNNANYLSDGYEVIVLKKGNNYLLNEEPKSEWSYLPKKIKHGYLSGVAFNDLSKIIIYWTSAW